METVQSVRWIFPKNEIIWENSIPGEYTKDICRSKRKYVYAKSALAMAFFIGEKGQLDNI